MDLERLAREAGAEEVVRTGFNGDKLYALKGADLARLVALALEEAAKVLERYDDYELSGNGSAEIVRALKPAASPPRP
jgi:hypothetical protein